MKTQLTKILLVAVAASGVGALIYFAPLPFNGVDWLQYHETAKLLWRGESIYGTKVGAECLYYNAPWLLLLLFPVAILPFRLGYAIFSVLNLGLVLGVAYRLQLSPRQLALLTLSPPVAYVLIHGQVDIFVVSLCLLLPLEFIPLVVAAKPHAALALVLKALPAWRKTVVITLVGLLLSLLIWGNWPLTVLTLPRPFAVNPNNFWLNFWPNQLPLAVLFLVLAIDRRDDFFLLAASPFMSPYAEVYSFFGPALALIKRLKPWQAACVVAAWWGIVIVKWLVEGHA